MKRFTRFPTTLYRLQNSLRIRLKEKEAEFQKGKIIYDYKANKQGLYGPRDLTENQMTKFQPNGMQFYSMSENFKEIIRSTMKNAPRYYYVVQVPQGQPVPQQTVLLQDPVQNHVFWLQTTVPCESKDFNSKIELLLLKSKIHRKKEFKPLFLIDKTKTFIQIVQQYSSQSTKTDQIV